MSKPRKLNVGKDSVVIGDVSGNVGDGSVVVGPTDDRGNVILNQPMAVGRNAFAGPGSIAIGAGAGAGAGAQLSNLINKLSDVVGQTGDSEIIDKFNELIAELTGENGTPSKEKSLSIISWLKGAAVLSRSIALIEQIGNAISQIM